MLLGGGATAGDLLAFAVTLTPHLLGYALPVAFLLGAVLGVARLADDRELVALGAAGVSPARLARVPLALGGAVAAVALATALWLEPAGLRAARLRVADVVRRDVGAEVGAGVFHPVLPGLTLYAEEARGGGWGHVLVADAGDPDAPLLALAEAGRLAPTGPGGELRLALERGELHVDRRGPAGYVVARFADAEVALGAGAALDGRNRLSGSPFELGPRALLARVRDARDPAQARWWRAFLHRRLAAPLAALAFALLAVPLGLARRGGRAAACALALGVVVGSWVLLRAGEALARDGALPAWLGPQLANLAAAAAGAALLARAVRRGVRAVR